MNFFMIFSKVSVIFLLISVGFALTRTNIISQKSRSDLTNMLLYAFLPCALIKAFQVPFNKLNFISGLKIALIMTLVYTSATVIAWYLAKFFTKDLQKRDIFTIGMVLPNVTFMGYPVIESVLGPEYLFYIVMAVIPFEIIAWSLMSNIVIKNGNNPPTVSVFKRLITSPPIIGITLSVILHVLPFQLPDVVATTIDHLAGAMTPVAMIIVGMSLASTNLKHLVMNPYLYLASAIKLLVFPGLLLVILKALGLSGPTLIIPVALLAMPTAGYTTIIASKYGSDATFAAEFISLCTLLSLLTIPIIVSLL